MRAPQIGKMKHKVTKTQRRYHLCDFMLSEDQQSRPRSLLGQRLLIFFHVERSFVLKDLCVSVVKVLIFFLLTANAVQKSLTILWNRR